MNILSVGGVDCPSQFLSNCDTISQKLRWSPCGVSLLEYVWNLCRDSASRKSHTFNSQFKTQNYLLLAQKSIVFKLHRILSGLITVLIWYKRKATILKFPAVLRWQSFLEQFSLFWEESGKTRFRSLQYLQELFNMLIHLS